MSIFPKRTIRNTTVTIHWNFNTAHLKDRAICPLVRIGVVDPEGKQTILIEKHLLALPAIQDERQKKEKQALYLNKNFPLLVMADYLGGKEKKEKLVEILRNIQEGRHYYFHFPVPENAPLGKYTLISEVISEGKKRSSKTAADDFFFVEHIDIMQLPDEHNKHNVRIANPSTEPIPVKVIDYHPGEVITPDLVNAFELNPGETRLITTKSIHAYLSYNEERELLPLHFSPKTVPVRNPYWLQLNKSETGTTYLFHGNEDAAYTLTPEEQSIWLATDGIKTKNELEKINPSAYGEMIVKGLITEKIL